MEIDETDKKILNALLTNSKSSFRDIAKKTGVSSVTVLNRMKNLEKENIIKSYTTQIDYSKAGYDLDAIIKLRVSKGKALEVEKKVAMENNVFAVYDITGDFDVLILGKFKNRRALDSFVKKLQTYDFVERTRTGFILNVIKEKNILIE